MSERRAAITEPRKSAIEWSLVFIGLVVLWANPKSYGADGEARLRALTRLVHDGVVESPRYSMIGPLFAAPLHVLGVASFYNVTLFTIALVIVYRELRDRLLILLLVFASMFANHVQVFYGEPFTALAVTIGVLFVSRGRTRLGWALVAVGAANTPATIAGVLLMALVEARWGRRLGGLAAVAGAVGLVLLENTVVRGSPSASGYERYVVFKTVMPYSGLPGFSYPMFFGLLAILFSFGKGLVFFTPGLFVPCAAETDARMRRIHRLLVAFVVGLVLVYSRWWAWFGGTFWGPRFFLAASVPAVIALRTHLGDAPRGGILNAVVAVAFALSFWAGVNGVVFDMSGLGICSMNDYAYADLCHYTPELSPLWHPFVDFRSAVPERTRWLALAVCAFWAGAFVWVARRILAQLFADVVRAAQAAWNYRDER